MLLRTLPLFLFLLLALMPLQVSFVEGMIHIPSGITRLLGISTDVSIELGRLGNIGPFALGLLSKAGLALGIMGTAATAFTFAAGDPSSRRRSSAFYDADYYNYLPYPRQRSYDLNDQNYDHYNHLRRRRSLPDLPNDLRTTVQGVAEDDVFASVHDGDSSECGKRLVCELSARSPDSLRHDEKMLLDLIRLPADPVDFRRKFSRAKFHYEKALWHGQTGRRCSKLYSSCPYSANLMMALIRTMMKLDLTEAHNKI